ncbi:nuclear transport factor 2 family protein [Phytoactinopolyspora halotolerans]|uniref:Nuclear transport factor 2 family protein n=1 Tax=Phytoactinopolyspora halotolerans TaxID=1981512 RepID=A0A6L9S804_9ACTN|nr:nuclear transport factor 2 family protein [Phytoactinopolyspora halotolerans]NEE00821.1 nuclear transport factor 2 family protein [Phytoactinopolyspora halotolerans]
MSDARDRAELVREYFRKVDAGDPSLIDMYTDDVELYFPKFGLGRGKDDMVEFARRLTRDLGSLEHDIDGLDIMVAGDRIVVEGREWGTTADGRPWPDGEVSTGRFCNVFTFRGDLISAVHIYTDPDFTSSHEAKVRQLYRGRQRAGSGS